MPAYLIVGETIHDPDGFEAYKAAVLPLIERFGGRFLVRGGDMHILESDDGWAPGRMVIVEFPTMAALQGWYESPDYAEVRELRFNSARSTLVAVEGC